MLSMPVMPVFCSGQEYTIAPTLFNFWNKKEQDKGH